MLAGGDVESEMLRVTADRLKGSMTSDFQITERIDAKSESSERASFSRFDTDGAARRGLTSLPQPLPSEKWIGSPSSSAARCDMFIMFVCGHDRA